MALDYGDGNDVCSGWSLLGWCHSDDDHKASGAPVQRKAQIEIQFHFTVPNYV